jgi:hypothetical protein
MADTKISALSSATTPLAGTEVVPIVQSGATVKVSVTDLRGSGGGASASGAIYVNNQAISTNYTIATGTSGISAGPISIGSGYAITLGSGARWVIV